MYDLTPASRDEALATIADSPTTLEFRSIALEPNSAIYRSGSGLLLVDSEQTILGAVGEVTPGQARQLHASQRRPCELLADEVAFRKLEEYFSFTRAYIAVLAGNWRRPSRQVAGLVVRPLRPDDRLDHLPAHLNEEIERHRHEGEIFAGFVDGVAAGLAYVASMTETWADISIDTLAEYRRRGIARQVVSALIDHIFAISKTPVWGAAQDNAASLALAASLGFTRRVGELFVHEQDAAR